MWGLWTTLLSVQGLTSYFTGRIAPDERVVFFPTSASQWNSTHWHVPIHGWIFEPEEDCKKRAVFRSLMRKALKVPSGSMEKRIFDHRIKSFVVDNERWKRPRIILAGKEYTMPPSSKNGHFRTSLILPNDELFCDESALDSRCLSYFAVSSDYNRKYEGIVHIVPPEGITILSDIDDTIKITNVVNKKEMLRNTFMREFKAVPGMAELYQTWSSPSSDDREGPHIHLHLLSASIYQLYEDLERFRQNSGFPPATYSLKTVRPKKAVQTLQVLLEDALDFKRRALTKVFETYPKRRFILVGDTGEKDPQIYASMAKDYPRQVLKIYLRSVAKSEDDDVAARVRLVMQEYGVDNQDMWTVFEDPSELLELDVRELWKVRG